MRMVIPVGPHYSYQVSIAIEMMFENCTWVHVALRLLLIPGGALWVHAVAEKPWDHRFLRMFEAHVHSSAAILLPTTLKTCTPFCNSV
jgi:hypothetical protein